MSSPIQVHYEEQCKANTKLQFLDHLNNITRALNPLLEECWAEVIVRLLQKHF